MPTTTGSTVLPFPASNESFLRAVFGDPLWRNALVAGFPGDPDNPNQVNWGATPAGGLPPVELQRRINMYFCPSLVLGTRRAVDQFVSFHAIVIDDYGTKVAPGEPEKLLGKPASYVIETSPGNFQAGWFCEPLTDLGWVKGMLRCLHKALGAGDNLMDPVIWRRLPVGINGKAKYLSTTGAPWQVAMAAGDPSTVICQADWPAIEARIGVIMALSSNLTGIGTMPDPGDIEADAIVQGLRLLGRIQGNLRATTMGWGFDIDCPWSQDHTARLQEGAVYVPVQGRFRCLHGHCQDRNVADLREKLNELVREHTDGLFSLAYWEFDEIDPALVPGPLVPPAKWSSQLQRAGKKGDGGLIANLHNVLLLLRNRPEFAGAFGFNAFTLREMLHKELPGVVPGTTPGVPREWRPQDTSILQGWLQGQGLRVLPTKPVEDAVTLRMHERSHHPVRDWLEGLAWDGVPRLDTWLSRYLGSTQDHYHAHVGRWWLMTMCRRVFEPGCRADYMVVLEGPQGAEKSTLLAALVPNQEWFSDHLPDIGTKDASEHLAGRWLIEVAEMDRFDRAESAQMKAFVSRTTERYRRAWGRRTQSEPRQCVFAGTVNHSSYLKDETGNRRYWPVMVGTIDVTGLVVVRDQLFAEAWSLAVTHNQPYWPDPVFEDLFMQPEQDQRLEADLWEPLVVEYLQGKSQVLVHAVVTACTGGGSMQLSTTNRNRVTRIMQTLKWRRGKKGPNNERFWYPV